MQLLLVIYLPAYKQTAVNFFYQNKKNFIDQNAYENIVSKMAAVLSRGR